MTTENRERENGDVIKYISHGIRNGVVEWLPLFLTPFLPVRRGAEYFRCCRNAVSVWRNSAFSVAEEAFLRRGRARLA